MDDRLDDLIFSGSLSEEARGELTEALENDPALREAFNRWQEVLTHLRQDIDRCLPDRELLVLYALRTSDDQLLTRDERRRVESAEDQLEEALHIHPGLKDVVRQIRRDKRSFDRVWEEHTAQPARARIFSLPQMSTSWMTRAAAAAAVVALTILASVWWMSPDAGVQTIRVAADQRQVVELEDGSTLRLLGEAVLSYDLESARHAGRYARVDGRALFQISSDERPFTVETETATARVLGTTFGVVADSARTELTVAEGHVALSRADGTGETVVVSVGQASSVDRGASPSEPARVDLTDALAWSGRLFFRESPVSDVVRRLEQEYDARITVAPGLTSERITGTFDRDRPLEEILRVLAATLEGRVTTTDAGIHRLQP